MSRVTHLCRDVCGSFLTNQVCLSSFSRTSERPSWQEINHARAHARLLSRSRFRFCALSLFRSVSLSSSLFLSRVRSLLDYKYTGRVDTHTHTLALTHTHIHVQTHTLTYTHKTQVHSNRKDGITVRSGADPVIHNNVIYGNGGQAVNVCDGGLGSVQENDLG